MNDFRTSSRAPVSIVRSRTASSFGFRLSDFVWISFGFRLSDFAFLILSGLEEEMDEEMDEDTDSTVFFRALDLHVVPLYNPKLKVNCFSSNYYGPLVCKGTVLNANRNYCSVCLKIQQVENNFVDIDDRSVLHFIGIGTGTFSSNRHLGKHGIQEHLTVEENDLKLHFLLTSKPTQEVTQEKFNLKLTDMMVESYLSFTWVERPKVRVLFRSIAPQYKLPCSPAVSSTHLNELFNMFKSKIVQFFFENLHFISICFDIYFQKVQKRSYISFSCQFIFENRLQTVTLEFAEFNHPQLATDIAELLRKVLVDFSLDKKKVVYVTDEGTNVVCAAETEMKADRIKCSSHVIHNLISKDFYRIDKNYAELIRICRDIYHALIHHMHLLRNETRLNIKEIEEEEEDENLDFENVADHEACWNSDLDQDGEGRSTSRSKSKNAKVSKVNFYL